MTVEEFIQNYNFENNTQYSKYDTNHEIMIEFAKYHVEKALNAAATEAWGGVSGDSYVISLNSILKSYPLENIK